MLIKDDKCSSNTTTLTWLTFALAFDSSARLSQHIRQSVPEPSALGNLITSYLAGQREPLSAALRDKLDSSELDVLCSQEIAKKAQQAQDWADGNNNHHLLGLDHHRYPAQLVDTNDAPPLLYAKGDLAALEAPALAIVGSRKASKSSIELSYRLAANMAQRGVTIVSGLARGIDAAAHEGALSVSGRTIAVAATAPDAVYPRQHLDLEHRIMHGGGLIITEYPLGSKTLRWYFPRRNRIISGLSLGVLVAEASLPSGTLTTATHAINQGREVMAIPGNVLNSQFKGCHSLIKQGAALVESEQDILDALAWPLLRAIEHHPTSALNHEHTSKTQQTSLNFSTDANTSEMEARILNALLQAPATIDELMTHTQSTVTELGTQLGMMYIEGKIVASAGGRYCLARGVA